MKEIQILNNGDTLNAIRTKINENFALTKEGIEEGVADPLAKFGVNEGNETDGVADLLNIEEGTLSFKVGGEYPNLVTTSGDGVTTQIESINPLHLQNLVDGEYRVVVDGSNSNITDAEFYSQLLEPENANNGDVWFNGEQAYEKKNSEPTLQKLPSTTLNINTLTKLDNYYLAIGSDNTLYTSENEGVTWAARTIAPSGNAAYIGCVAFKDQFILLTSDRQLYRINKSWQLERITTIYNSSTVIANKLMVQNDTLFAFIGGNTVLYATNESNWSAVVLQDATIPRDIVFIEGNYYLFDNSGKIFTTTNLTEWTEVPYTTKTPYCAKVYGNKILIGCTSGSVYVFEPENDTIREIPAAKQNTMVEDIEILEDGSVFIVGMYGLGAISYDLTKFEQILTTTSRMTAIENNIIVGHSGEMYKIQLDTSWVPYPYIPIGEVIISGGEVTYFTTYPYNTNGLHEASSSSFGLLRTAAVVDELNCHCSDAVLTPANLYNLNNYRTMNTEYQLDEKVGCPYHHNLQLKCIQAGTTSNEGLNTRGSLEAGTTIEDGTVIWEVEELGTGGGAALPMFTPFWSDHLYKDVSYLRADNFSWHDFSIYRAGYETLEEQYNDENSVVETENGITYKRTPDGYKIADVSQQDAIRSLYETNGIAWYYILDTELKRFKLPRTKFGFTGVRDEVGKPVKAELPNIEFAFQLREATEVGTALNMVETYGESMHPVTMNTDLMQSAHILSFDASLSNPIYKDGATVQQPATQMYLYFYVGKSKKRVEADITEAVKIITPYFFGKSEYHKTEPNNPCLLKSQGQENYKTIYPDFYDWLLEERNNPTNLEPTCNVTKYGNVAETKGVLSGFSTTSYAEIPVYPANMTSLEMHFKFTTGSEAETTLQAIFGNETANRDCPQLSSTGNDGYGQLGINFSKTGSTWDCILIAPYYSHKTYEFHCIWDGSTVSATLTDEDNVTTEMTILSGSTSMDQIYWGKKIRLGLDISTSPFFGSIDLTESYINVNGSRWWTGANAVKQVGTTDVITDYDYVINTENETFILPLLNGSEDLPSDRYEDITIQETGKSYNAPANGWYYAFLVSSAAKGHWGLTNNSSGELSTSTNNTETGGAGISIYLPAKKSDSVVLDYYSVNLNHAATKFRFIYAQGGGDLYFYVGNGIVNADLVDVARIEATKANRTDVDGRWTAKLLELAHNVTLTNSTGALRYDLSNYLPNDGFDYEIKFSAVVSTGTTSRNYINIYLRSDILPDNTAVTGTRTNTTQDVSSAGNVDMPIGTQRYIEVADLSSANANGVFSLNANGYRRIGKNI